MRFKWLLKLSKRGQIFSWDLQPGTRQWYVFMCISPERYPGCLLCLCLFKSLTVLKPSFRVQVAISQRNGLV
jgi:hypothetical protein